MPFPHRTVYIRRDEEGTFSIRDSGEKN